MTSQISQTTWKRLAAAAQREFERVGLSDEEARNEAESFAYSAAEFLENRLDEAA